VPGIAGKEEAVASLTALKFETADGADRMVGLLQGLQAQQLITVQDAAVVTWAAGANKPKTRQLTSTTGAGALGGAFWGMLFGLLFFIPFFGLAIGAATGALMGHFADIGIDDNFIKQVQIKVTPGTSALFLLSSNAVPDRVAEAVKAAGLQFELIASNLSAEQEAKLKEVFGE
jgi:uncharacterized membrane protein